MLSKKGAMFGLDARIALAIFGALSVISGAALYSAIQHSKVVRIVTDLNEVGKAIEAFMLDTGDNLTFLSNVNTRSSDLVNNVNNFSNWNGPYLNYEDSGSYLLHSYGSIQVYNRSLVDSWGGTKDVDVILPSSCPTEPCVYWAILGGVSTKLSEAIDLYVDGVVDYKNGRLRVYKNASGIDKNLIYLAGPGKL